MLLSICIPTKDRAEVLRNTLESVYCESIDNELFEIVISDNSCDDKTKNVAESFIAKGMNINYFKSELRGFYNSITVMRPAKGAFIKLHNDYTKFNSGALQKMIDLVRDNMNEKPQMLFTDGNLHQLNCTEYTDFNSFMYGSSFWNSWSSAYSVWREDLVRTLPDFSELNESFPHTSVLFLNNKKRKYIIDDRILFTNSPVQKKGGYNLFKVFSVVYIDMIADLKSHGSIEEETYLHIKKQLRNKFIPLWLQLSVFTENGYAFDNSDYYKYISMRYSFVDQIVIALITFKKVMKWKVLSFFKR